MILRRTVGDLQAGWLVVGTGSQRLIIIGSYAADVNSFPAKVAREAYIIFPAMPLRNNDILPSAVVNLHSAVHLRLPRGQLFSGLGGT